MIIEDNLPNRITLFRILLIPIITLGLFLIKTPLIQSLSWENTLNWITAITFTIASLSDWMDGYIARNNKQVTMMGSFLDPIADKFLSVSTLVMLLYMERVHVLVVIILILREFYVTSLRLLISNEKLLIPSNTMGKYKTTFQYIGMALLIANDLLWIIPMDLLGTIFLYIATLLSCYSALTYSIGVIKKIKLRKIKKQSLKK